MEIEKSIFHNNNKYSEKELCKRMTDIRSKIEHNGNIVFRGNTDYDDAAFFLDSICATMSNAPLINSLEKLIWIWDWELNLDDEFVLVYVFLELGHIEDELVNIYLVRTRYDTVRMFSVIKGSKYTLYEYANECCFDYGEMEFEGITKKIKELLDIDSKNIQKRCTNVKVINKNGAKVNMKLCPKCGLNYIKDDDKLCIVCKEDLKITNGSSQKHKTRKSVIFNEDYIFKNERATYRGKYGFKAYNSNGDNVGIVFMTDDNRRTAFGYCELCFYPVYQNRYGEWHKIISNGSRIKWERLCELLNKNSECKYHID